MANNVWISEAIVDFLRGPLYIHPLMGFIDVNCLIFTPDEENKFEYTEIHEKFKELVDQLLTNFVLELGLSEEQFYETVSSAQDGDKLTKFVVSTLLTVDDFMMFKTMMVKRNCDLTTQVLDAVEKARQGKDAEEAAAKGIAPAAEGAPTPAGELKSSILQKSSAESGKMLEAALQMSAKLQGEVDARTRLEATMRALQLEDEETAIAAAMAASLKDCARYDLELAEIEQAIALSLALEEERQRLERQAEAAEAARAAAEKKVAAEKTAAEKKVAAEKTAAEKKVAAEKTAAEKAAAPAPTKASMPTATKEETSASSSPAAPTPVAVAKAAAVVPAAPPTAEPSIAAQPPAFEIIAARGGTATAPSAAAEALSSAVAPGSSSGSLLPPTRGLANSSGPLRPLRVLPSTTGGASYSDESLDAKAHSSPKSLPFGTTSRRGAGFRSDDSADLRTIRQSVRQAAETQKKIFGLSGADAAKWMEEAKLKLVAQNNVDRDAEMKSFREKQEHQPKRVFAKLGGAAEDEASSEAELEARRAALREQLAARMKQQLLQQQDREPL